ncbi:MAG TPA: (2Fe-2S)-binding protein [Thermodesulfobacteriota bacterium]|nr:(2Fe-2S)-binding protein [Thermodesulfobacteriota bacterium]
MKKEIAHFKINGGRYEAIVASSMTLYELLRELHLTGTKRSCGVGECGSCTVLVDGNPTLACSTLAMAVRDKEILTIEGLAKAAQLHPLQQAFIDTGAIQCGFCTPGMIMMAKALLDENPKPTRQEVSEGLGGNLCRCTGYVKVIDAVLAAAEVMTKGGNQ